MINKLIAIVIIVLIFFLVYSLFANSRRLLPIKKMSYTKVKTSKLEDIVSNNYYFSLWYNVHGIKKSSRGNHNLLKWLTNSSIKCEKHTTNKMHISLNSNLTVLNIGINQANSKLNVNVYDVPIDGWNNVIVNVNHNVVDVFINGELRKTSLSQNLGNTIIKGSDTLCIGNKSLNGYIGNIIFGEESISTEEVFKIYKYGLGENPIKSIFDRYRLKLSVLEQKAELNSLEL
tara:strand:- start:312 stop:1004 length:693 start_codon:yes stop_codon:yes gene_type:complete